MALLNIFKPKWKHSNPKVRATAIKTLGDDEVIEEIAKNDKSSMVRISAIEKGISDQLRDDIAKNDKDTIVRIAAIKMGISNNILYQIAKEDDDPKVRLSVINELISKNELMKNERSYNKSKKLIKKIARSDKELKRLLKKIAKSDKDYIVRIEAINNISDIDVLAYIFVNEENKVIHETIQKRIIAIVPHHELFGRSGIEHDDSYTPSGYHGDFCGRDPIYPDSRFDVFFPSGRPKL